MNRLVRPHDLTSDELDALELVVEPVGDEPWTCQPSGMDGFDPFEIGTLDEPGLVGDPIGSVCDMRPNGNGCHLTQDTAHAIVAMHNSTKALISMARRSLELQAILNKPDYEPFLASAEHEAKHQVARYGEEHDLGKDPSDWFWLLSHLATKCLVAHQAGDRAKALHHTISCAAVMAHWHGQIVSQLSEKGMEDANS